VRARAVASCAAPELTPAELRVAGLAAQDMSNREIAEALFVSLRTVETHLTHAYQKLEIGSRGMLAAALAPPTVR
jgi:DNA-binding CsgD family transcriptional regulator